MAKLFGQRPSDLAILDETVGEFGRFFLDRGVTAFGQAVQTRVEKAASSSNPAIARTQQQREWERLMGGDMTNSATGFADPSESMSTHGRSIGKDSNDDGDDMVIEGDLW